MFDFVMKMFSEGDAALPALGGRNPKTTSYLQILFCTIQVVDIRENSIFTSTGAEIKSDIIILATEANNVFSN
jgi:hypothetical protein